MSGSMPSGCWRCIAAAARPTPWTPTARREPRSSTRSASSPGPELRRLHEAILRQDPSLDLPAEEAIELPLELDAGTPLVGREDELASLREHRRHAHGGAGRIVLIAGGRGMGKTRLAAELAGEVHRDRGVVRYASGAGFAGRRARRAPSHRGGTAPDAARARRRRPSP